MKEEAKEELHPYLGLSLDFDLFSAEVEVRILLNIQYFYS